MDLLDLLTELEENQPVETKDRIELMLRLQAAAKLASSLAKELSLSLAKDLKDRGMKAEAHGPYVIEWHSTATRKWDSSRLLARMIDYAEAQGCELHGLLTKVASVGYWRMGELKKLGFDPKAFCDEEWSAPTVIVVEDGSHADNQG